MNSKDWLRWAADKFDEADRSDQCSISSKRAEHDRCSTTTTTSSSSPSSSSSSSASTASDDDADIEDDGDDTLVLESMPSGHMTADEGHKIDIAELEERVVRVHEAAQRMSDLGDAASRAEQAAAAARAAESKAIAKHEALKEALAAAWREAKKASSRARAAESSAEQLAHRASCATEAFDDILSEIHDIEVLQKLGIS